MNSFWNPTLELLDLGKIRELQFSRFKEIFSFAYNNSKQYNELYSNHNINLVEIEKWEDIQRVPIIEKKFFESDSSYSLYGDAVAVDEREIAYYHQTSGTTSNPLRQPDTYFDWIWWAECWANVLWSMGVRAGDRVLFPFNYNYFIAFWGAHYAAEKIGAEIVSTGGLSTRERILKIFELNITTVITTPTYAIRMAEVAESELNIDLKNTSVKRIICAGEPGLHSGSVRQVLSKIWGCDIYDHVGATEVGAWGYECMHNTGGVHVNESMFLVELLSIDSDEVIIDPDITGRLVITAFHRKGRPCIRFDTKDLASWSSKKCACGSSYRVLKGGVKGRIDHLLKVKGTLVAPTTIENIIQEDIELGNEYQIVIGRCNLNDLELYVELCNGKRIQQCNGLADRLKKRIHQKTSLNFKIILKEYMEMERAEVKSKRVIDLRKK